MDSAFALNKTKRDFLIATRAYGRGVQPTAREPQSSTPGQSMWPSTMAGQKIFFF